MEELPMLLVLVEVARRQHGGDDRHLHFQLHGHQALDHRLGHEFVPVDAAVESVTTHEKMDLILQSQGKLLGLPMMLDPS